MSTSSACGVGKELVYREPMHWLLRYRIWLIVLSQILLIISSYYCSFVLRLDMPLSTSNQRLFWESLPVVLIVKLALFYKFGLLRGWWRYVGMSDVINISWACF